MTTINEQPTTTGAEPINFAPLVLFALALHHQNPRAVFERPALMQITPPKRRLH